MQSELVEKLGFSSCSPGGPAGLYSVRADTKETTAAAQPCCKRKLKNYLAPPKTTVSPGKCRLHRGCNSPGTFNAINCALFWIVLVTGIVAFLAGCGPAAPPSHGSLRSEPSPTLSAPPSASGSPAVQAVERDAPGLPTTGSSQGEHPEFASERYGTQGGDFQTVTGASYSAADADARKNKPGGGSLVLQRRVRVVGLG